MTTLSALWPRGGALFQFNDHYLDVAYHGGLLSLRVFSPMCVSARSAISPGRTFAKQDALRDAIRWLRTEEPFVTYTLSPTRRRSPSPA